MKHTESDCRLRLQTGSEPFTLSPITSAGIQARNFTAGFSMGSDCIAPKFYTHTSLRDDISKLCDPATEITDERLFNIVVKYFCAYVDETAFDRAVSFSELVGLYENFGRHQSLNEPEDNIELMNRMRQLSGALRVLADAPRMAHVLRDVITMPISDDERRRYVGVDLGVATGIMLVGQFVHASRNEFRECVIRGYTTDPVAGERTHDLVRALGVADVLNIDPARPQAYRWLEGLRTAVVVNEMLSGMQRLLKPGNFFNRYKAFAGAVPGLTVGALYYPEGIIAYSKDANMSLILSPENGYSAPPEYAGSGFTPQGFVVGGGVTPTHKLGEDFYRYLVAEPA